MDVGFLRCLLDLLHGDVVSAVSNVIGNGHWKEDCPLGNHGYLVTQPFQIVLSYVDAIDQNL